MHDLKPAADDVSSADAPPFLRLWAVTRMTGLGRSTIYRLVAQDRFPLPVRLASRAVAWRRCDLERWSQARPLVSRPAARTGSSPSPSTARSPGRVANG